ncbi:MFS transporter [Actinorhabdospora filicis]|uniref:MFS transporter n=1 Tax=Actinorhabdospora filicis TaxID=1785913 RepID=A0A9W6SGE2_9ACTN|nr:MFS transporter [Actinorhabdospora filicis]GLZ75522.1 MFS transporter [Actinorhabdospora filicis]
MSTLTVKGHRDFGVLWTGRAISQFGSDVGAVALPLVAVGVLDASAFQIGLLAAIAAATTLLLSFPVGAFAEHRRKRPVLVAADLARCLTLLSVPVAALAGALTFAQLCAVAAVNAAGQLAFAAASQAHLKALVDGDRLLDANARLESTTWLSLTVGRSLGGVLAGLIGALGTLVVDAVSFLAGALAVTRLRAPEPAPPERTAGRRRAELLAGLAFVRREPALRRLLAGWVIYAGASAMAFPVSTVFYLRDLGFTPWQYGLLMGVPSLGGFFGARVVRAAAERWGMLRLLRWSAFARGPWYGLIALAPVGVAGLVVCGLAFGAMLFFSSIANSAQGTYRQLRTPDGLQVRVAALWAFATTAAAPLFTLAGTGLAALTGTRGALGAAAALMLAAAFLSPARE